MGSSWGCLQVQVQVQLCPTRASAQCQRCASRPAALLPMQVRTALADAVVLAPQLGYGSGQEVMQNAVAASDPQWQACVFGVAPPPAGEGTATGRDDCHP